MGRRDFSPGETGEATGYAVQILTLPAELARIEGHWKDLEARVTDRFTFFQSFDWCAGWIRQFAAGGKVGPRIVCVWQDERLVMVWPGMITGTPMGGKLLTTLGEPHTQYSNALIDPAHDTAAMAHVFGSVLKDRLGADAAHFGLVPAGSSLDGVLKNMGLAADDVANETAYFNLDAYADWASFLESLPANQRKSRKRRRNQLAKLGTVVLRDVWPGDADFASLTQLCMTWKTRWLAETGRLSRGFSVPGYDTFLAGLAGDRAALEGAVLFSLEIDGRPVALEFGLLEKRHYYSYIGAFDWDLRDLSPGKVAMESSKRWLMEAGIAAYDLLGNPAEYKSSWSNCTVPLLSYRKSLTFAGSLVVLPWIGVVSPALKSAYQSMPDFVRRTVATAARPAKREPSVAEVSGPPSP